jgi:hypothetical protein
MERLFMRSRRLSEVRQGATRVSSVLVAVAGGKLDQRSDYRSPSVLDHRKIVHTLAPEHGARLAMQRPLIGYQIQAARPRRRPLLQYVV